MKIVRSVGVSTLVALMSAHREAAEQREPTTRPFSQATVAAIEDYLRRIEPPPNQAAAEALLCGE